MRQILLAAVLAGAMASVTWSQGTRKDDIVFGSRGTPVAGATITVCTASATGTPCSPLATIYTDATLTVTSPNPFSTDGLGNYHFYAAPGRYQVQISGVGITTYTMKDVILPNDPSSPTFSTVTSSGSISALTLSLGGNLSVGGNATVSGTLTATSFSPSSITATGSESVKGPQPRVDVTAYGAKGDGSTDDTAAIQAAINAICNPSLASNATTNGGTLYFPPTGGTSVYIFSQPTTGTTPAFDLSSCYTGTILSKTITFEGGASFQGTSTQFSRAPQTRLQAKTCTGVNTGPVLLVASSLTFTAKNMTFAGCNQAIQVNGATQTTFRNVCLTVNNTGTLPGGTTDNVPLFFTNAFWFLWDTGCIITPTGNPAVVIAPIATQAEKTAGLMRFENIVTAGGGFLFDQRVAQGVSEGNIEIHNVQTESANVPFFSVTSTGGALNQLVGLRFSNTSGFDCSTGPVLKVNITSGNAQVFDVVIDNAQGCDPNTLVQVVAGTIVGLTTHANYGPRRAVDGSGNLIGSVTQDNFNGFDFVTDTSSANNNRLRTDCGANGGIISGPSNGVPIKMCKAGAAPSATPASLGIDPAGGYMLGDGISTGYNAAVAQPAAGQLGISMAGAMPVTGLSATLAAGGTLVVGTQRCYILNSFTATTFLQSSPSPEVCATPTTGNQTINLAWTAALGVNVGGYYVRYCSGCVAATNGEGRYFQVNGGATASFSDTGQADTGGGSIVFGNQTLGAIHLFNLRKFGVNNTTPSAQLDVIAQDASTVGFNVKAAASPTANPWQVSDSTGAVKAKVDSNFNFSTSGHMNQAAANGDVAGTVTLAAGAATKTFSTAFASAPVCIGTDQTAANAVKISTTTTAATFAGTATDVIAYVCVGNPN